MSVILVVLRPPRAGAGRQALDQAVRELEATRLADGVFLVQETEDALKRLELLVDEIFRGGGSTLLGHASAVDREPKA